MSVFRDKMKYQFRIKTNTCTLKKLAAFVDYFTTELKCLVKLNKISCMYAYALTRALTLMLQQILHHQSWLNHAFL